MKTYNGWKNRETWNVVLGIGNDLPLYSAAQEVARVPRDATDEPLDWVVTEREAIRIAKPGGF